MALVSKTFAPLKLFFLYSEVTKLFRKFLTISKLPLVNLLLRSFKKYLKKKSIVAVTHSLLKGCSVAVMKCGFVNERSAVRVLQAASFDLKHKNSIVRYKLLFLSTKPYSVRRKVKSHRWKSYLQKISKNTLAIRVGYRRKTVIFLWRNSFL